MPASAFQYAILRVIPSVERGEALNAGVVLYCRQRRFLGAKVGLDTTRLAALAPGADPAPLAAHLEGIARIAAGDPGAGPIAVLDASERFGWLVAPASTMIQASPVHMGLAEEPDQALERLFARLVAT